MDTKQHGGKRENAGRKPLVDAAKKQTAVIRLPVELLPMLEQLKQGGLIVVTANQDNDIERLKQRSMALAEQHDKALQRVISLDGLKNTPLRQEYQVELLNKELTKLKQKDRA